MFRRIVGACLFAAAALLPAQAHAAGSMTVLGAAKATPSIVALGKSGPCDDGVCQAPPATIEYSDGEAERIRAATVAMDADDVVETVPPVALDEKTASVEPDEEEPIVIKLFNDFDLRTGTPDTTP